MKELNRISVGEFNIKDSITIGELENNVKNNDYSSIIYIEKFFENSPEIIIDDDTIFNKYLTGVEIKKENISDGVCRVYYNNKFVGICEVKNGNIKRDIVED